MQIKLLTTALLVMASLHREGQCAEDTRSFSSFGCSYTLPGGNWEWMDEARIPNGLFVVRDDSGLVLSLAAQAAPPGASVTNEFMAGVERKVLKSGIAIKRSSRTIQFKSVACHQLELDLPTVKKMAVTRVFIAGGFVYQLQLLGTTIPDESSPEFSKIMNGLEFLEKPAQTKAPEHGR